MIDKKSAIKAFTCFVEGFFFGSGVLVSVILWRLFF